MSNTPKEEVEPVWSLILVIIMFTIMGAVVWSHTKPQALEGLRYLRLFEFELIRPFTNANDNCIQWLKIVPYGTTAPTPEVTQWTQACFDAQQLAQLQPDDAINYYSLTATSIFALGRRVSSYVHWTFGGIFGVLGLCLMFFSRRSLYKTRHNLESFIRVQARMWPVIMPIVNFKPADYSARSLGDMVPDQLPPFAEALSPEEWIAWHRIPVTNGVPEREAVRRAFLLQLGPRWNGVEGTPLYIQGLFASFALKGAQKREDSDNMLGNISTCWDIKKGFAIKSELKEQIQKTLRDSKIGATALHIADQHAYRTTALLGTLKWARSQGGVLAPAQFLWLRGLDRTLWYPLNNMGRRSFHTEGAGAMAHFMAEQNAKKPLPIPRIDTAIVTLNQYLASDVAQPIPPREEPGGSGRKGKK